MTSSPSELMKKFPVMPVVEGGTPQITATLLGLVNVGMQLSTTPLQPRASAP